MAATINDGHASTLSQETDSSTDGASAPTASRLAEVVSQNRLSIPANIRIPAATSLGFFAGVGLGLSHGGQMAGMRFRAENSHRFPTSQTGWYLYHKSKNYHIMLAGIKEGLRMGLKVGVWAGSFFVMENYVDGERGTKDFVSTAVAGLGVAGSFSLWNRFPAMTTMRTLKTGLYGGLIFGFAQDALGLARGRHLRYVDFLSDMLGYKAVEASVRS